jgi:hypothetical protein
MTLSVAESWVETPLSRFVRDSRARRALLLHPSGQVLGQYGFVEAMEVMTAAALASAIYSSAGHLGEVVDGRAFSELHHGGGDRQIYIAETHVTAGAFVLLAVFGGESSLGLVRLYSAELFAGIRDVAPAAAPPVRQFDANFERELRRSLSLLFGGSTPASGPTINHPA